MESSALAEEQAVTPAVEGLQPKQKFTGKVVKTTIAGAIIDIGQETPGVVHISQLQKEPVNRVEDVVQVGQEVEVWIRRVDSRKNRIDLTMIKPLGLDWREIEPDMVIKGTVTRLEKFGAFVDIGAERPGLVHISELTHGYVKDPSEVVKEGDEVEVKVLKVSRRKRQIKLSMKALTEAPAPTPKPERTERPERSEREHSERGEGRGRRSREPRDLMTELKDNEPPVPTAMEIALREAMERSKKDIVPAAKARRKNAPAKPGLEDILERTLENKIRSGK